MPTALTKDRKLYFLLFSESVVGALYALPKNFSDRSIDVDAKYCASAPNLSAVTAALCAVNVVNWVHSFTTNTLTSLLPQAR
mmetsp:Transcript_13836/g.20384  ORF Transcript_13836/g.20384 Transcript_13836/m.20384 type:complete len:82 (+) Transcript_13836:176-421(+)